MLSVLGRDLVVLLPERLLCFLPVVRAAELAVGLHRSCWPASGPARHVVGPERFLDHGCVRRPADQGELLPADQHPELVAEHFQRVVQRVGVVPADVAVVSQVYGDLAWQPPGQNVQVRVGLLLLT